MALRLRCSMCFYKDESYSEDDTVRMFNRYQSHLKEFHGLNDSEAAEVLNYGKIER